MSVPTDEMALDKTIATLSQRIENLLTGTTCRPDQRILIALAGVPGSGKSTVSAALLESLNQSVVDHVVVVPMDGFHFSKKTLATFPRPDVAFRRRGAPFTFDADAFIEVVASLKRSPVTKVDDLRLGVRLPSFDHAVQDPVQDDIYVPSSARIVIVEGNYLLLDESPWNKATPMFNERWFVDVPAEIAKQRLIERHMNAGIENTRQAAAERVEENDIRNGELIRSKLIQPDLTVIN